MNVVWLTEDETRIASGPHDWPVAPFVRYEVKVPTGMVVTEAHIVAAHGRLVSDPPQHDATVSKPVLFFDGQVVSWQIVPLDRETFKAIRQEQVNAIRVTVDGMVFDGDETSQTRMARAIAVMDDIETTTWVLADNTVAQVTKEQLRQALRLAGEAQTAIWVLPS